MHGEGVHSQNILLLNRKITDVFCYLEVPMITNFEVLNMTPFRTFEADSYVELFYAEEKVR